jgi:type I restriction enzyme S subunit
MLRGSIKDLQGEGRGNTFAEIPARVVKEYELPIPPLEVQEAVVTFLDTLYRRLSDRSRELPRLPAPLSEQRRIVAKIDRLAERIERARGLRHKSTSARDALLRSSMRVPFLKSDSARVAPLESVCSLIIDCLHSNPVYSESGLPTLRSPDVGWGMLDLAGAKRTSEEEYQRRTRRAEPEPGDIVLVREGGGTGKAGIVPEGERCSLGQRVMMLRADRKKTLSKFLLYQWLSPLIQQDQIEARMKGSASPHLNIRALRKFPFVLPPLVEQRRIVAYLDDLQAKVDAIKKLQEQTAAELGALLPSILDKAFKGEL